MSEVLDTKKAAELLMSSEAHTRTMAMRGDLPAFKIGDDWRFIKSQLIEHLMQVAGREQQSRKFDLSQQSKQPVMLGEPRKRGRPRVVRSL